MANGINAIGNLQGKVDANNQLLVALGSGSTLPSDTDIDAGTGTADAGIGGVLTVSTTQNQTNAGVTEEDLWTYNLPANTLSANNYLVRITAFGSTAANANNKTVRLYFGGTLVSTSATVAANDGRWTHVADVYRTGASAQRAIGTAAMNAAGDASASTVRLNYATIAADTTAAIVIKVTGQNGTASAGDILFLGARVEFLRAGS